MNTIQIPYHKTKTLSPLAQDYLAKKVSLSPFYGRDNKLENYQAQMEERSRFATDRKLLVEVLKQQNSTISLSNESKANIEVLSSTDSFTITTGHQLCLFTGPLYFIYKIVSAINLSNSLKERYPNKHFVPVFWLASEDHDFEEINSIPLFGQNLKWNSSQSGAVGRMHLTDFSVVLDELNAIMGKGQNAEALKAIFQEAYSSENVAQASRILVNALFGEDGIVIVDGDDKRLKATFVKTMKKDMVEQSFHQTISCQSESLSKDYKAQAFVREINFFRLEEGKRTRITGPIDTDEIDFYPDRFSPNVLMRPLYQETVLPNIAYIGGGAEMAYWMQLKIAFESERIPFPILVLRNSALIASTSQMSKIEQLGFSIEDFFNSETDLHKAYIRSRNKNTLEDETAALEQLFEGMKKKFNGAAFQPIIDSEIQRQKKALEKMAKKLYRLEKQKHEIALSQISKIKTSFFPNANLQERHDNFIPFYLKYGDNFIKKLKEALDPLETNFVVLAL